MPTLSSKDGPLLIDTIKHQAQRTSASLQGANTLSLIQSGKRTAAAGLLKEDEGDLQEALLKYYTVANVLEFVFQSAEYKKESANNKHGAVFREAKAFAEYLTTNIMPRIKSVQERLQQLEEARAPPPPLTANGDSEKDPGSARQEDESRSNHRPGGSIADRMKMLQGAGLDMSPAVHASKRIGHRSTASTSTTTSVMTPLSPRVFNDMPALIPSPTKPSFSVSNSVQSAPTPSSSDSSSRRHSLSTFSPGQTVTYSPSLASMQSPSPSATSTFTSLPPPSPTGGLAAPPQASPYSTPQEIRRHGTGSSGISSSPRHRNLQNLAGSSSPRLNGSSTISNPSTPLVRSHPLPSNVEPATPSFSHFNHAFPSIEELDDGLPVAALPSVPENNVPMLPSVPGTKVGAQPNGPGPAPPSDGFDIWRTVPVAPSFFSLSDAPASEPSSSRDLGFSSLDLESRHGSTSSVSTAVTQVPSQTASVSGTGSGSRSYQSSRAGDSRYSPSRRNSRPLPIVPGSEPNARLMSVAAQPKGKKPDIPLTTTIFPKTLQQYLDYNCNGGLEVLLLDVRTREEFRQERIACKASVCLDPTILLRGDITASAIETALVIEPPEEDNWFRNRDKFDIVIICDQSSTAPTSPPIVALNRAIYEMEFYKKLARPPMLLVGGLAAWKKDLGTKGLVGTNVQEDISGGNRRGSVALGTSARVPAPGESRNGRPTSYSISSSNGRKAEEPAYSGLGAGADDLAEKERRRKAHVRDGAVFEPRIDENAPPSEGQAERLVRRSTLVRPSSSGNISAYNRPIPDMQADGGVYSGFPIAVMSPTVVNPTSSSFAAASQSINATQPSSVAIPPQASLSKSPLARRRSDYVEQALYSYSGSTPGSARAPIDYPALSSASMLKYPPPVATPTLDRQEPRHRSPLSPINQPSSLANHVTTVNGQPFIMPPTINTPRYHVIYWDDIQIGMSGLKNLGNTCYMNSVVQCLSATVPFARFFIDGRWRSSVNMQNPLGTQGNVANAFASMVYEMWQGESPYLTPYTFRKKISAYAPQFSGSDQHDAQEFLSFLLDGLHEDLNRIIKKPAIPAPTPERERELETLPTQIAGAQEWQIYRMRDDSLVVDYFQGQFKNVLRCMSCKKTSTTYNSFMYLSLPIPSSRHLGKTTLNHCVDAFVKEETLEKSDAWKCPHCKTLRKATKELSLSRLPPVLLIVLKRFSFKGPFTDKLETMVDFPLKGLDLTNYMPSLLPPGVAKSESYGQEEINPATDPRAQVPPYKYDLFGVTNHFGSLSSGHYTAFIASKGGWVYCDDSRLTAANTKDVVGRPAYILFYKRVRS